MTQQATPLKEIRPRFVVDTPPFIHRGYTTQGMMRDVVIALAPAMAMAVWHYGLPAVRVLALCAGSTVIAQWLWEKALGRPSRVYDCSALAMGLIFACLLPAGAPWWLAVIGSALTIILGREVFGGLGCNPLCPPLVGWAALTISWPTFMDPTAMNLTSSFIDPLLKMQYFGWQALPEDGSMALFLGEQLGGLGSAQIAGVLVGGLYLLCRNVIRWEITLSYVAGVLIFGTLFWHFGDSMGINPANTPPPQLYLLTGSTLFGAFFLATDHASSPVATGGMILYGLSCGFMIALIQVFGMYPDPAPFAILMTALCTPLFDLIRNRPFGKRG